jgi:hypothetical protein
LQLELLDYVHFSKLLVVQLAVVLPVLALLLVD